MLQKFASLINYSIPVTNTNTTHHTSGSLVAVLVVAYIVLIIYAVFVMWKVFKKAGRPGWAAIIPFYNGWVLFEISDKPGWWVFGAIFSFIPFIGWLVPLILFILAMINLSKFFGKSTVFTVFGLVIFSIVGFSILAFGPAKYQKLAAPKDPPLPPVNPGPQAPPAAPAPPTVQPPVVQ